MIKKGTYYVGRVLKLGLLDQKMLFEALLRPTSVQYRGNAWTFTGVAEYMHFGRSYMFGRLSKYAPEGEVDIVDEHTRSEKKQAEPNLLIASSPFIYIPEHSGIVFLNTPNQIEVQVFIRRFSEIVEATHGGFFVGCHIDLVSDLKTFAAKLKSLQGIYKIEARVSPPNPLFSPLWESLEKYLRSRNTDRMTIVEDAQEAETLKTDLPKLVEATSLQTEDDPFIPDVEVPIGDAAVLMAADGYGSGVVRGKRDGETIVIKTAETALNFAFEKTPHPEKLYIHALAIFESIEKQRHMEHGK